MLVKIAKVAVLIEPVGQNQIAPEVPNVDRILATRDRLHGAAVDAPHGPSDICMPAGMILPTEERLRIGETFQYWCRIAQTIGVGVMKKDAFPAGGEQRNRLRLPPV